MQKKLETQYPVWTKFTITLQQVFAIVEADIRKLRHDPYELFTRMIQPAIWLLIFGQAMAKAKAIPTGEFLTSITWLQEYSLKVFCLSPSFMESL